MEILLKRFKSRVKTDNNVDCRFKEKKKALLSNQIFVLGEVF